MATPALPSGDALLPAVLLTPAGEGPHPLVVVLNGFPGNERNADLAQALRRLGYATLSFHYRGSWGTPGTWSWAGVQADVANVLSLIRDGALAGFAVDPTRVALVGHSLGGFTALRAAAADPGIRAVAVLAPFDLGAAGDLAAGDTARHAAYVRDFDGELLPLRGTSGAALVDEMVAAAADWRLSALAERLADRPVLLVGGDRDAVADPDVHFRPLLRSYATNPALEHALLDTDHALSDRRVAMIRLVAGFLGRVLPVG
ncbi:alpha/beta fold hydrolase [Dactylosporangium sp. NPDC049140]|uniref:alpha/beta hydrolase family protein n=1 Tax=Dactylosporangium sp. NPDC049140 TaxID=3155647 RepID=UPI0033E77B7F